MRASPSTTLERVNTVSGHHVSNRIPTAPSFLLIPSICATGGWQDERLISSVAKKVLGLSCFLAIETDKSQARASRLQRREVIEFRLCDVLVHAARTNTVVVGVPQADSLSLECFDSAFVRQGDETLVQYLSGEFPKIVRGIGSDVMDYYDDEMTRENYILTNFVGEVPL